MPVRNFVLLAWLCIALAACTQAGIDSRSTVDSQPANNSQPANDSQPANESRPANDSQPDTGKPAPVAAPAQSSDASPAGDFEFVVLGDTAYNVPQDYPAYYALIDAINAVHPVFSIHVGDTKGGGTDCGDAAQRRIREDFRRFEQPLVYTPGDNEWTDCWNRRAGGYDPLERLAAVRELFFAGNGNQGGGELALERQEGMPENALWWHAGVLFASAHIVGSNNGLRADPGAAQQAAFAAREAANVAWLQRAFAQAQEREAAAVVLAFHANMFLPAASPDGFARLRPLIGELAAGFGGPVLLLQGDYHFYILDRPYPRTAPNVQRLQTYGAPMLNAVRIQVQPGAAQPFTFAPVLPLS